MIGSQENWNGFQKFEDAVRKVILVYFLLTYLKKKYGANVGVLSKYSLLAAHFIFSFLIMRKQFIGINEFSRFLTLQTLLC